MMPFAVLAGLVERDGVAALVTVVTARGSTPREAGARMVVARNGDVAGTIGGGRLEMAAHEAAVAAMADGRDGAAIRRFALGPALGQCCGGHVTLAIETIAAGNPDLAMLQAAEAAGIFSTEAAIGDGAPLRRRITGSDPAGEPTARLEGDRLIETFGRRLRPLLLFGAGHVGRALVMALAPLPFQVTWIDERTEMFPPMAPRNVRSVAAAQPAALVAGAAEGSFVLVMTHDHEVDLAIVHAALASGRADYVGLIGSATKRARFESRLAALGLPPAVATSFHCPIGVPGIASKEPAMIAAAVVADLLIRDGAARAGRGRTAEPLISAVAAGRQGG